MTLSDGPSTATALVGDRVGFRALTRYSEPDWVTRDFVAKGLLPPVRDRLARAALCSGPPPLPRGLSAHHT